jgi:hypothetical protein
MKNNSIKITFLIPLLFVMTYKLVSCTCVTLREYKIEEELATTEMVFYGKVISSREVKYSEFIENPILPLDTIDSFMEYTFIVKKIYKGNYNFDTLRIYTGKGNGDCGIVFSIAEEYIVYSNRREYPNINSEKIKNFLFTDICTRTGIYSKREDKRIQRALKKLSKKKMKTD